MRKPALSSQLARQNNLYSNPLPFKILYLVYKISAQIVIALPSIKATQEARKLESLHEKCKKSDKTKEGRVVNLQL